MDKKMYPWLLSRVLERRFVGTKQQVDILRRIRMLNDYFETYKHVTHTTTGSYGDGFMKLFSDIDIMSVLSLRIVMDTFMKQQLGIQNFVNINIIPIVETKPFSHGYVYLQVHKDQLKTTHCLYRMLNEFIPMFNYYVIPSYIFKKTKQRYSHKTGFKTEFVPRNKDMNMKSPIDNVDGFFCCGWPQDAQEWICRDRVYGWPSKSMVYNIASNGYHVVPISDKYSENEHISWRISFALAERYLAHSLNFIQFKVYGLLKYLLKQMKYRIEHETGDGDILSSYFIKTVIFYAVENSPQSLWQEKDIFVCFHVCLTMLIDWVQSGYCPNYFMKNNMFRRRVCGENKIKLLNILCEVKAMKWKSLSVGSAYLPSIWTLINDQREQALLTKCETSIEKEYSLDSVIFGILSGSLPISDSFFMKKRMIAKLLNAETEIEEMLTYTDLINLLLSSAMKLSQEHKTAGGNKYTYRHQRKCKHWMSFTFGSTKLYLATYFYHTGSYGKAIELCGKVRLSVYWHDERGQNLRYKDTFCGRGYSFIDKIKLAFSGDIIFFDGNLQFCLSDLHMEVKSQHPLPLSIPPLQYALFLSFMCHHNNGDTLGQEMALFDLLANNYDDVQRGNNYWIVHTMVGICYQTKGDYQNAIISYMDSLAVKPDKNPALERIVALEEESVASTNLQ